MINEKDLIWNQCLENIKVSVSSAIFSTWFSQTKITDIRETDRGVIVEIGCSSLFVKATIETRYFGLIQDLLSKVLDKPCDIIFSIQRIENAQNDLQKVQETPLFQAIKPVSQSFSSDFEKTKLRSKFTFENYAVSGSNQMAWAAAEAVAQSPGSAYNPLFIWGGVGVGKTHLMNAVGYTVLQQITDAKVLFCTGEDFTNDIVDGIRTKSTQKVREKYRRLNLLLIDDIQFIAGKDAVQEEFFHTFNALVSYGSQIILTSDRPPSEISKLEERLRSRFEAGLIVDIGPPDFELRCAIVQIKSMDKHMELPMDLVQLIAGNIEKPRQIEGFLVKLYQEIFFKKMPASEELIKTLLGKSSEEDKKVIKAQPNDVIQAVSRYFTVGKRALLGTSRARPVSQPRQILMYLLRIHLQLPLQEVGKVVGGRDHTTVMHAVDKITTLASQNVQIQEDLRGIKNLL